jgi:hypothetical protein
MESGICSWSSVLIAFTVPMCIYHQSYDALILWIPVMALARAACVPAPPGPAALRGIVLACALLPLVNYLATDTVLQALALEPGNWKLVTLFNATTIALGFLVSLYAAGRAPPARGSGPQNGSE